MSDRGLALALFGFSRQVQEKVMATDWPSGWEWRMHPGTWIRIKSDTEMMQYVTPAYRSNVSAVDDLLGSPVVVDASIPLDAVELRYADQMMLPTRRVASE